MKPWQESLLYYWGKHMKRYPADDGVGYQYRPGIIRAIVADGAVDSRPSWENSPQVRAWMAEPRKSILRRFKEWLDK